MLAVDNRLASAEETAAMVKRRRRMRRIRGRRHQEATLAAAMQEAKRRWGRIDMLHYNVGVSLDRRRRPIRPRSPKRRSTASARSTCAARSWRASTCCRSCARSVRASSSRSRRSPPGRSTPTSTYKATKAAMIAFTQQIAIQNAEYGIRANVILPGLMDTPMAVDTRARRTGKPARRDRRRARRQGAVARQDGHRLGCRQCGAVSRLRRGEFHHRRGVAGRRRLRWCRSADAANPYQRRRDHRLPRRAIGTI